MQRNVTTLTRQELVRRLSQSLGISPPLAASLTGSILAHLCSALSAGEDVKLTGFGTFHIRDKSARQARNPKTGKEYPISARRVVTFKASDRFKMAVAALPEATPEPSR